MPADTSGNLNLPFTLLALISVLVLAWLVIRLLAKTGIGKTAASGRLRIRQSLPIGSRERLVLLEFDGDEYLLGVTTGGITVLEHKAGGVLLPREEQDSTSRG